MKAEIILAYILFDAENTTRLGEQSEQVFNEYVKRAKQIIHAINYHPVTEIEFLANEIKKIKE